MTAPNSELDQISAITRKYYLPKLADAVFVGTPELKRAKEKSYKRIGGGEKIVAPLEYAESNFQWYSGSETLNTSDTDTVTGAQYDWRQCSSPVTISRINELKNSGEEAVIDHVRAKMKNAEKTMRQNMSIAFWNAGTDPKAPIGVRAIISTSNTIGGISQTNNSWWRGKVDSSTTTVNLPAIEQMILDATEDSVGPTVLYGTKTIFGRVWGLLQPQQRFADEKTAKAGFQSLMISGLPLIACSNAPANHLVGLCEEHFYIWAHKDEDMRMDDFERPRNQNVKSTQIFWAGAYGSSNNRHHFLMSALSA